MIAFRNIIIKQFRAYEDVRISFHDDSGVFLMSGDNGSGKSTLLNAINWCLYGDTPFYTLKEVKDVANKHANNDAITEVDITALTDTGTYRFLRKTRKPNNTGNLEVSFERDGNWQVLDQAQSNDAVKRILPKDIRHLFFFNGERLKDIFTQNNDHDLKSSVYKVSELNIIDNAIIHLRIAGDKYLTEIKKLNFNAGKIEKLKDEKERLETSIKGCDDVIEEHMANIKSLENEIKRLDELIKNEAVAQELIKRRDMLNEQIKEININLINSEADKLESIQENYHRALLFEDSLIYKKALEQARDEGLIPPPISPEVTKQIIHDKWCICGREVGDNEIAHIQRQHDDYLAKAELQFLTDGIYAFQEVSNKLSSAKYIVADSIDDIRKKEKAKKEFQEELKKVNEQLSDIDTSNLHDNPEARRINLTNKIGNLRLLIINAGRQKVESEDKLKTTNEELRKNIKADGNTLELERKWDKTEQLQKILREIKTSMEAAIRSKLKKSVWDTFSSILPDTNFVEANIDEGYDISLTANDGIVYPTSVLSVGQTKALGLSLAYGLSKDLGYSDIPLLIDNLYGDLSDAHFGDVTKMIESLSVDKQVVVMDLNVEKTRQFFGSGSIKQMFEIKRDAEDNRTLIQEIKV